MNLQEADILKILLSEPYINQKRLVEISGHSTGMVNRSLHNLKDNGYLDDYYQVTPKAITEISKKSPQNAIILAAGPGMRMVPINMSSPKALLEVNGERLIDRIITQLKEVGVNDIIVVVGFMKDSFEYLIDEYGVELIYNPDYAVYNNLHSLALVSDRIHNTYIIPCDIWCDTNPFSKVELYSWYMVSDLIEDESAVRVNRKMELVTIADKEAGNAMIGIAYLLEAEAGIVRENLKKMDTKEHADDFWEKTLYKRDRMIAQARIVRSTDVVEINTYEQLRDLDSDSNYLKSDAIQTITKVLECRNADIVDIKVLKKGMTNRSFLFTVNGLKYIMRIPGEGTDQLINRHEEAEVFRVISGHGLCDDPVYINPKDGYKITKFLDGVRVCNKEDISDLKKCMKMLRTFHQMKLSVSHTFNIFDQIELYESLWKGSSSIYRDYNRTKENVLSLKGFVDSLDKDWCLTHIDAVPDNFLFYQKEDGEGLQLTDWEYAGMQDPHVDIAMFCIYSLYNRQQCDCLIDLYFEDKCNQITRAKIYAYISMCGLLWSNWCEFKRKLGVEFGEYSLRQYRFAKEYYRYAKELIRKEEMIKK